jgi:predicted transcriptional regulator
MEKKHLSFKIDPDMVKKLKFLAVEHDKTVTDLLSEAIKDLFQKYEKKGKK